MSTQSPVVSVLVPTYNRSAYLQQAVASILAQSFVDFEIIITDNCSPDDTEEQMNKLSDSRIVYVRNSTNIGPANNHNRALRLARGKYIYFFSDDDVMLPDNLAAKVRVMEEHASVGLVHSNIRMIDESGAVTSEKHWASYWMNYNKHLAAIWQIVTHAPLMSGKQAFDLLYYKWNFVSMPSVLIRSQLIHDNRLEFANQLTFLIDWDLWMKLALFADFYYLEQPLVEYRIHSKNEVKRLTPAIFFQEILISKLCLLNLFPKKRDLHSLDYVREVSQLAREQLINAGELETDSQKRNKRVKNYLHAVVPLPVVRKLKALLGGPTS